MTSLSDSRFLYEARRLLGREGPRPAGVRAEVRRWYWRFARLYAYEICDRCGRPVGRSTGPAWWEAPDWLWEHVNGDTTGVMCMPCFAEECCDAGYLLHWYATPPGEGA